jgi:hypothetical protein
MGSQDPRDGPAPEIERLADALLSALRDAAPERFLVSGDTPKRVSVDADFDLYAVAALVLVYLNRPLKSPTPPSEQ